MMQGGRAQVESLAETALGDGEPALVARLDGQALQVRELAGMAGIRPGTVENQVRPELVG